MVEAAWKEMLELERQDQSGAGGASREFEPLPGVEPPLQMYRLLVHSGQQKNEQGCDEAVDDEGPCLCLSMDWRLHFILVKIFVARRVVQAAIRRGLLLSADDAAILAGNVALLVRELTPGKGVVNLFAVRDKLSGSRCGYALRLAMANELEVVWTGVLCSCMR